jgi:DNA-binding transcriptional MerR regulator
MASHAGTSLKAPAGSARTPRDRRHMWTTLVSYDSPDRRSDVPQYRISQAARLAGVSNRTLRFYEELGLVTPALTTDEASQSKYSDANVARINHIRDLQELLGFGLSEIKQILSAEERLVTLRHDCSVGGPQSQILGECMEINTRLQALLGDRIAALQEFRAALEERAAFYRIQAARIDPALLQPASQPDGQSQAPAE